MWIEKSVICKKFPFDAHSLWPLISREAMRMMSMMMIMMMIIMYSPSGDDVIYEESLKSCLHFRYIRQAVLCPDISSNCNSIEFHLTIWTVSAVFFFLWALWFLYHVALSELLSILAHIRFQTQRSPLL